MTDLALAWDPATQTGDLVLANGDLALDDSLHAAVTLSLMCDRLAAADDSLPNPPPPGGIPDRRGWQGDAYLPPLADGGADLTGSRLWLLTRALETAETLRRAEDYARDALAWMIQDGVAGGVDATASWTAPGQLLLRVTVERAGSSSTYAYNWSSS